MSDDRGRDNLDALASQVTPSDRTASSKRRQKDIREGGEEHEKRFRGPRRRASGFDLLDMLGGLLNYFTPASRRRRKILRKARDRHEAP